MSRNYIIESGTLPDGTDYRIWQCARTGKKIGFVGHSCGGLGKRRSVKWIREQLEAIRLDTVPHP